MMIDSIFILLFDVLGYAMFILLFGGLGYAMGNAHIMERLDEKHPEIASEIREDTRIWWNGLLESYKAKTKEQKIAELKEELEALENE